MDVVEQAPHSAANLPSVDAPTETMQFALHGPTLTLRPPVAADADVLLALASDAEVTRWFSWGPYTTIEQPLAYIEDRRGASASAASSSTC